jgi:hypothetical protein
MLATTKARDGTVTDAGATSTGRPFEDLKLGSNADGTHAEASTASP